MGHPQDKVKVVRGRGMAILIADSRANEGDQVWGDVGPTSKIANWNYVFTFCVSQQFSFIMGQSHTAGVPWEKNSPGRCCM